MLAKYFKEAMAKMTSPDVTSVTFGTSSTKIQCADSMWKIMIGCQIINSNIPLKKFSIKEFLQ